ncbi:MAG TPA: isochorismatase family cysteine hydrolase [Nocardioides sp.]|nr:isochorismatase family cysteine hydrolase [Nocardioides sp.]
MPLTTIDERAALVVIDLQAGIVAYPIPTMPTVIAGSVALAEAFRASGRTVVLVNVTGAPGGRTDANPAGGVREISEGTEVLAELGAADVAITKRTRGAFHGTALAAELADRGITQIFLTGVATGSGVEETAREAYAHGLNVVFVTDAMADMDEQVHEHCLAKVFAKIGESVTTEGLLARL